MDSHEHSALNLLRIIRTETDAIGVAVSFGKDSLAVLDLCCRVFDRVEAYYLFRVRDLDIVAGWGEDAKRRFGVQVRMYPHFDLSRCYRYAVLRPHDEAVATRRIGLADIEGEFRRSAKIDWIAYGWRRNDSRSRAIILRRYAGFDTTARRVFPIRSWRRGQVYDYLDAHDIPRPPQLGRKDQGGLDFNAAALSELSPEDYRRWLADFPFSGVQIVAAQNGK